MRKYRKPYRIKRSKSIFKNRFFWLAFLTLVVISSIFYFLFFSAIFQIKKIIIAGEEKVSARDIKQLVPLPKNIFLLNLVKVEEDILDKFPQIAKVETNREFPDILNIVVVERFAVALWCEDDSCLSIDNEGVIFEEAASDTDLMKIRGEKMIEKEVLRQILEIQLKLLENSKLLIAEIFIVSDERLNVKTSDDWEIYFNLKGNLDWQMEELDLVLEKQIPLEERGNLEYVDLRFSRVYFKYK